MEQTVPDILNPISKIYLNSQVGYRILRWSTPHGTPWSTTLVKYPPNGTVGCTIKPICCPIATQLVLATNGC